MRDLTSNARYAFPQSEQRHARTRMPAAWKLTLVMAGALVYNLAATYLGPLVYGP